MSSAYANAGTLVRPYYMDPSCPDYLKPAQWTQGSCCAPYGSIFNGGYGYAPAPMAGPMVGPVPVPMGGCDPYAADDGKISFGTKVTSFVKGVFKPITNMFSSPGNFLKGALCIAGGAALIAVTGGAATPLLVAAGVVGGGLKIAKGAVNAAGAQTDAEAIAAWEDMGEGTGVVAASVAGSKAALRKAGVNTEGMSYLQATKKCFTGAKGFAKTSWSTASAKITGFFGKKPATTTTTPTPTPTPTLTPTPTNPQLPPASGQPAGLLNAPSSTSAGALPPGQQVAGYLPAPKATATTTTSSTPINLDSVIHMNTNRAMNGLNSTSLPRVSYTGGLKAVKTGSAAGGAYYHDWRNGNGTYSAYKAHK